MLKKVEQILNKYSLLENNKTLIVGFSGGADSVCLCDIIYKLSKIYNFKLILCHLNHNWRGEDSKKDMDFCINFAKKRNIEILSETLSKDEKQNETNARELRYKFFEKCLKKTNSDAILLAHNRNDKAETLIYRLIKGTGLRGLVSIKENRDNIVRPLINISRVEIEEYCKENNLNFVTDKSNYDNKYNRNYIRNEILPKFEKINPKYIESIITLSNLAEENETILENILLKSNNTISKDKKTSTKDFLYLSDEIKKRIILNIFLDNNIDYNSKRINKVLNFIKEKSNINCGSKISITKDLWLFVSSEYIKLINQQEKNNIKIQITKEGNYEYLDYIFKIEKYNNEQTLKEFPKDEEMIALVELKEPINFELRYRQEGDYIQPLGMNGTQKLKKYLNSKKIKEHERNDLIYLCKNSEVYWIPKIGMSEKIKVVTKPNYMISLLKK